jgi:hypothetical protein
LAATVGFGVGEAVGVAKREPQLASEWEQLSVAELVSDWLWDERVVVGIGQEQVLMCKRQVIGFGVGSAVGLGVGAVKGKDGSTR